MLTPGVVIFVGATHGGGVITAGYLISCLSQGGLQLNGCAFITTGVLTKLPLRAPPAVTKSGEGCGAVPVRGEETGVASRAY